METVEFKISPDGEKVEIDAKGFIGGKCKDFTKATIKKLGMVTDEKKKPSFYETVDQVQGIRS